jgi:hypothetical protein
VCVPLGTAALFQSKATVPSLPGAEDVTATPSTRSETDSTPPSSDAMPVTWTVSETVAVSPGSDAVTLGPVWSAAPGGAGGETAHWVAAHFTYADVLFVMIASTPMSRRSCHAVTELGTQALTVIPAA